MNSKIFLYFLAVALGALQPFHARLQRPQRLIGMAKASAVLRLRPQARLPPLQNRGKLTIFVLDEVIIWKFVLSKKLHSWTTIGLCQAFSKVIDYAVFQTIRVYTVWNFVPNFASKSSWRSTKKSFKCASFLRAFAHFENVVNFPIWPSTFKHWCALVSLLASF